MKCWCESRVPAAWCTDTASPPRNSSGCDRHKIRLVTAVDKVAASGGYLMASVSDHIIAAPFALVGSIGVVAQIPNVHRLLKKHDVDVEVLTAGKYKRTLTIFGENTDARARQVRRRTRRRARAVSGVRAGEPTSGIARRDRDRRSVVRQSRLGASVGRRVVDERCVSDERVQRRRRLRSALGRTQEADRTAVGAVLSMRRRSTLARFGWV